MKPALLLSTQHRQLGRDAFEAFRQMREQRLVVAEQLVHPLLIEAVGAILDGDLEGTLTLRDEKRQIELRSPKVQCDRLESSFPELFRRTGLLVDEHGLKDRMSVPLSWRRQCLGQSSGRQPKRERGPLLSPGRNHDGGIQPSLFVDERWKPRRDSRSSRSSSR